MCSNGNFLYTIAICNPPCGNGTCIYNGAFRCQCNPGYKGSTCDDGIP